MKSHKHFGFTLIEVSLFIAITGMLFIGITVGTQNSIWHQRFNDSTQNFAEFLRSLYSQVSNPQSTGDGRSDIAIYGKLVVFGETVGLDMEDIKDEDEQKIFVYDVVGNAAGIGSGDAREMLQGLNANVVIPVKDDNGVIKRIAPAGNAERYSPRWGAEIETTVEGQSFKGSMLIIRHPRSGTINTLISNDVIEVNKLIREANATISSGASANYSKILTDKLANFTIREEDFCINPYGRGVDSDNRRDIRLVENARNASGIEIIDLDNENNRCRY